MNKHIFIIAALLLSACTTTKETMISTPITVPIFHPANPRAVVMKPVTWQVLEVTRLQALLDDAKKQNKNIVLFALNTQNYENLSLDMQELKRYILQLQQLIVYYKAATKTPAASVSASFEELPESALAPAERPSNWYKKSLAKN